MFIVEYASSSSSLCSALLCFNIIYMGRGWIFIQLPFYTNDIFQEKKNKSKRRRSKNVQNLFLKLEFVRHKEVKEKRKNQDANFCAENCYVVSVIFLEQGCEFFFVIWKLYCLHYERRHKSICRDVPENHYSYCSLLA